MATAKRLRVPAVNNHGGFKLRVFVEVDDPSNAKTVIRQVLRAEMEHVA